MKPNDFCHWMATLLFVIGCWAAHIPSVDSQPNNGTRRLRLPGNSFTALVTQNKQLCSAVLPPELNSLCSGEKCTTPRTPAAEKIKYAPALNSSNNKESSTGSSGLGNIIARMDDGISMMNSVQGTTGDNTFILGLTGAGKSTLTLLLTAYATLYSCKRTPTDLRFVIRDVKKVISTVDSLSKTKIPEITYDPHLQTTFYDCPGFSDTNSTDELTNAYFIKHALDSSKRAKILLVAPFHTLQPAGDRHYFASLIQHVVKTVKNVDKYSSSFALAVTFASPFFSQDEIVSNVAGFLNLFLNEELESKFEGQEELLNKTRILLESLLGQDEEGRFVAIGIFRTPTQHGPLRDIETVREDREQLLKMLTNGTFYTNTDPKDFDYSVSDSGKLRAAELGVLIDDTINRNMQQFWALIQHRYDTELSQVTDPIENKKNLEDALHVFKTVRKFFNDRYAGNKTGPAGPKKFIVNLMSTMAPLRLDLPSNPVLSSILLQESHVKFVENLLGKPAKPQWTNWLKGIESVVKSLELHTAWTKTLIQLERNLATYQIQSAGYSIPEFRNESGLVDVTVENIQGFVTSEGVPQELHPITAALTPFASASRGINFRQLNPIIEYFSSKVTCESNETVATIAGNFILASKLAALHNCISATTEKVVIYAWDTFFLDAAIDAKSLTQQDTFDLIIIADKLKSLGQKILLSGKDAINHEQSSAANDRVGADGLDATRGGDFVGLFGKIQGDVSVESNGGKGGAGQDGGEGTNGKDGRVFGRDEIRSIKMDTIGTWLHNYPDGCRLHPPNGIKYEVIYKDSARCSPRLGTQSNYEYIFTGVKGFPGRDGGQGGAAGQGGEPGVGKMYEIVGRDLRSNLTDGKCGPLGSPGAGGKGGLGGLSSSTKGCVTNDHEVDLKCTLSPSWPDDVRADGGDSGRNGIASSQCQERTFDSHAYTPYIINYKTAARAQLTSSPAKRRILPFLVNLEKHTGVNNEFFTAKSFITDLAALENQLPSLLNQADVDLIPLYNAVLNRTAEALTSSDSEQERAILRHAASLVYGRLAMLNKRTTRSNLITDLEGYIDHTNQVLKNLKTIETNSNAADQIIATKEKFLEFMQSRIKEVDDLTEQVIQPQISKIQDELKKAMDAVLKQLMDDRQKALTSRNEQYTKQFGDTLLLGKIFGFLKIGAQALSFLGPWGAAAGAVISTASSVAQSFTADKNGPSSAGLASELQNKALSWHFESQKQKLEDKQSQLKDIKEKFEGTVADVGSSWPESFQSSKQKIDSALNRVDELTSGVKKVQDLDLPGGAQNVIESLEQEATSIKADVKDGLEAAEETLKKEGEENKKDEVIAKKILGTTQKLLSIVNTGAEIYKLFKKDDAQVEELAKAEKVLEGYDNKVATVDSKMPQILSQLEKITTEAFKSVRNESSSDAALDISSWQLQSTLDDIGSEIERKILSGAPIDSQVKAEMGKLKEAFRTLFKICDRIQDYVTEQRMATFISDSLLSTVDAGPVEEDPELHRNLQKLKFASQSNLVLNYWQNIEDSFRLYVFPYADIYLTQISLLKGEHDLLLLPQNVTDLPTLVTEIYRRTGELKAKLVTFRTSIVPELHANERVGGFDLGNPLYTWTAEETKAVLSDLFSGRPVNLIADVRQSPISFDAIKFNAIHLHFIHENATVNATLQSALSVFGLNMNHGGVNYYRFDEKHYRVYSEPLSLQMSYQIGPNQHRNQNYVKLGQGPPLLSPYTLWTFQLYKNMDGVTLNRLRQFIGQEISLVLTGYGTYVTNSDGQSEARQVDRFYEAVQL